MTDSSIHIRRLTKAYRRGGEPLVVLDELDLEMEGSTFYALMGPSGSGKTTLLSILGCIMQPTSGKLTINGQSVVGLSPEELAKVRRENIGFIFQSYNLFPTLNAIENVRIALDVRGIGGFAATGRAEEVLRDVGLGHRLTNYPGNLSGGEQQRVAVARAIASSPSIVLADEPTAALDSENGHAVMALLSRIAKEQQRSVLAVTHDPRTLGYADRVVRIEDGRIVGEERRPEGVNSPEITDLTKRRKLHA